MLFMNKYVHWVIDIKTLKLQVEESKNDDYLYDVFFLPTLYLGKIGNCEAKVGLRELRCWSLKTRK